MPYIYRKPKVWRNGVTGIVIGDPPLSISKRKKRKNTTHNNAKIRKSFSTLAEKEFEDILNSLNEGVLKGRFVREWAFADKWILDFFFFENRLGIEIDGSIHKKPEQMIRDREKEKDCRKWSITLVRITNREVLGNRKYLIEKLREAWRKANNNFKRSPYASL